MRKNDVKYANFVCKFGELNLADRLKDIVLPSLMDDALLRKQGKSSYLFIETDLHDFGDDAYYDPYIIGRFVKNTLLGRDQIYDPVAKGVVEDKKTLASAPSAYFMLRLRGHRLIYTAETTYAPTLSEFESTVRYRLRKVWKKYIERRYKSDLNEMTKTAIIQQTPRPSIIITPVAGKMEISEFISRFSIINRFELSVNRRNIEVDPSGLAELIEEIRDDVDGDEGKLIIPAKDGLDIAATEEVLTDLTEGANQSVTLRGKDQDGVDLVGNEHDFAVTDHLYEPPNDDLTKAKKLKDMFDQKVADQTVPEGNLNDDALISVLNDLKDE